MKSSASELKPFQSRSTVEIPGRRGLGVKNGWAVKFQIEIGVANCFRRRTFHVLNSMY